MKIISLHVGYGERCPYGLNNNSLIKSKFCEVEVEVDYGNKFFYYIPNDFFSTFFETKESILEKIYKLTTKNEICEFVDSDIKKEYSETAIEADSDLNKIFSYMKDVWEKVEA